MVTCITYLVKYFHLNSPLTADVPPKTKLWAGGIILFCQNLTVLVQECCRSCRLLDRIWSREAETKWPTFLQTTLSNVFFWTKIFDFLLKFHEFVLKSSVNNSPVLVQIMAWCRTGDNPLCEPMIPSFTDACVCHWGSMSYKPSCPLTCHQWNMIWVPCTTDVPLDVLIGVIFCFKVFPIMSIIQRCLHRLQFIQATDSADVIRKTAVPPEVGFMVTLFSDAVLLVKTHSGQVTHTCVSKLTIISSDNGLSPGRRQAIVWTNVGILLIGLLGTNFSEISIVIHTFSFKKMHLKMPSEK